MNYAKVCSSEAMSFNTKSQYRHCIMSPNLSAHDDFLRYSGDSATSRADDLLVGAADRVEWDRGGEDGQTVQESCKYQ